MTFGAGDRVKEFTSTTGTGALNLSGADAQFQTFVAGIGNGHTCDYCILDGNGIDWETGTGTINAGSPDVLTRTTVFASSNAGAHITLTANTHIVFCTAPANRAVSSNDLDNAFSSTQGALLKRGASGWVAQAPGTDSQVLTMAGTTDFGWAASAGGGGGGGGGGMVPPAVVQAAAVVGTSSAVTFAGTPTAGNVLLAVGTHWSNNVAVSAGWTALLDTNGNSTDGIFAAYRVCGSGESTTQTPFGTSAGGESTAVWEITGVAGSIAMVNTFQESNSATPKLNSFNSPSGLVVGAFSVQGSNYDYPLTGVTATDVNVTATTPNNSPRRIKAFHVNGVTGVAAVTAVLDTNHDTAGFMFFVPGIPGGGSGGTSGPLQLISTQTATSSASLAWTGLAGTVYRLIGDVLFPATHDTGLVLQFGTGSTPTWQATGYSFGNELIGSSSGGFQAHDAQEGQTYGMIANHLESTTGTSFDITITGARYHGTVYQYGSDGHYYASHIGGVWTGGTTFTAIRLQAISGNITQGSAHLYQYSTTALGGGGGLATVAAPGLYGKTVSYTPTSANTGLSTWLNQGSSTVANVADGMAIVLPAGSGANRASRLATAPATPYTINALCALTSGWGDGTNNPIVGFGWSDGTQLHEIQFVVVGNVMPLVQVAKCTSSTAAQSTDFSKQAPFTQPIWFQIGDDGTNVSFGYSYDGVNYVNVYTVAKASGFLGGSGYSHIAFTIGGAANNDGITKTGTLLSYSVNGGNGVGSTTAIILDDIADVTITSPTAGQSLNYTGTTWTNSAARGLFSPIMSSVPTQGSTGFTTWANQGSATVTNTAVGIQMAAPNNGNAENFRILYKPAPATPYKVTALISLTSSFVNTEHAVAAIGFYDGTKLEYVGMHIGGSGNNPLGSIATGKYTSLSGGSGFDYGAPYPNPYWVQIEDDGSALHLRVGTDGVSWRALIDEVYSAFMGTRPPYVFFGINPYGTIIYGGTLLSYVES